MPKRWFQKATWAKHPFIGQNTQQSIFLKDGFIQLNPMPTMECYATPWPLWRESRNLWHFKERGQIAEHHFLNLIRSKRSKVRIQPLPTFFYSFSGTSERFDWKYASEWFNATMFQHWIHSPHPLPLWKNCGDGGGWPHQKC